MIVTGEQANRLTEHKIRKMGLGLQIFRWSLVLGFLLFMLVIGFGAKERGVSILAFACAGIALYLVFSMIKSSKNTIQPIETQNRNPSESQEDLNNVVIDDQDETLGEEYMRYLTDPSYIGQFGRHKPF
ncbi:MAG: hypothetical protein A2076_07065 [Geobacteraceae bacterium GWC2_53_11]|nr:MAG: hypothetical protein A2076_07065 [Geobacteraceae bacterium GWC2_53_11]